MDGEHWTRGEITALCKYFQAPTVAAIIKGGSGIKGKAHGQESTVRDYPRMPDIHGSPRNRVLVLKLRGLWTWQPAGWRRASAAQTAAFAVCGSSLGSRFRNRGQTPVVENYRRRKVRAADPKNGGSRYIRLVSGVAVRVRWL